MTERGNWLSARTDRPKVQRKQQDRLTRSATAERDTSDRGGDACSLGWMVSCSLVLIGVDLGLKVWASSALRTRPIALPGPVDLQLAYNNGVAFGRLGGVPPAAIIAATLLITVGVWVVAVRGALPRMPAVLIASGATANVLDRFEAGSVVDLFHTGWWPTFNLADVYITAGAVLLVLASLRAGPSPEGNEET